MAIVITGLTTGDADVTSSASVTTGVLTMLTNDIIIAVAVTEGPTANATISNSGTALSWNPITSVEAANNCWVYAWWAKSAGNENRTVTFGDNNSAVYKMIRVRVCTGAHQTDPVPAGNVFSGSSGTDVSQAITPTASGSALWFICGDFAASNTFAAIANCSFDGTLVNYGGRYTSVLIAPTVNPRTDANAFTIGETDTGGTIAWVAFEVQAAAVAPPAGVPVGWLTA